MMRKNIGKRVAAAALAVIMSIGLVACGGSKDKSAEPDKTTEDTAKDTANDTSDAGDTADTADKADTIDSNDTTDAAADNSTESDFTMDGAEVKEWGDYTVSVPKDWTFREGDALDETDTRYCSVKKSELSYIDFIMDEKEDAIMNKYNYNKETYTNEQKDVSGTYGDIAWTGFEYGDGFGGHGCELYASVGKKFVRIAATFGFDSPELKGVLESLKIKG